MSTIKRILEWLLGLIAPSSDTPELDKKIQKKKDSIKEVDKELQEIYDKVDAAKEEWREKK